MIVVAIGITVIGIAILGGFLAYDSQRDNIERVREKTTAIQNDRLREELQFEQLQGGIAATNTWGYQSRITGILVLCDDGHTITTSYDFVVPPGDSVIPVDVERLGSACR